jgi:hypothetical protein
VKSALQDLRAEAAVHVGPARREEGLEKPELAITIEGPKGALPIRFAIGRGDVFRGTNVYYARRDGVDATFVIAQSRVRPLLELP